MQLTQTHFDVTPIVDFLKVKCQLAECDKDITFLGLRADAKHCCQNHRKLHFKRLKQQHDFEVELGKAARGLLCSTPKKRREFDGRDFYLSFISPNLPRMMMTPELEEATNLYQSCLFDWMQCVAESKFTEGARPKAKNKSKAADQRKEQAGRLLDESYQVLHLLLEGQVLLKDKTSVVTVRVAPDAVDVNERPTVPEPTPTVTGWEHRVEHKS